MLTPSYVALSSQAALSRQMDVVANNLANASTAAYKAERVAFRQYLVGGGDGGTAFVEDAASYRDPKQGPLRQTGNSLDIAIDGAGYLAVATPDGERYTRNGHLQLGPDGTLVTAEGYTVQGDGGAGSITFPNGTTAITITKDGTVSTVDGTIGKIRLVGFEDDAQLRAEANDLYVSDATPTPATGASLRQGMIEESNVQPIVELTRLMDITRSYGAVSDMINSENDRIKTAIDKLSKIV